MSGLIRLTSERAWRTYIGGRLLDYMHGNPNGEDTHFPEEWIMSVTACRNAGREDFPYEGMSRLCETGELLADVIKKSPKELLGSEHYETFGDTTGVLVKLIDSAERLSIQVHPNKEKARKYFDSDYGKTESWHILGVREIKGEKPCIYLGFKKGVTQEYWKQVFEEQDIDRMLGCLNKIEVKEGETYLIEGGVPHALGAGCFLLEVQEPTDYTIRTERVTPSGFKIADVMCHQGIGFDNMFDCFEYDGMTLEETVKKYRLNPYKDGEQTVLIGYESTPCFRLYELEIKDVYPAKAEKNFYGIYILEGEGSIIYEDKIIPIRKGDQFFVAADTEFALNADRPIKAVKFGGPCSRKDQV